MNWNDLEDISQLDELENLSKESPVLIFKHSTRCSISSMAKFRLEREWDDNSSVLPYYLDLISFRDISNEIEERYGITHQSPQAILLKDGEAVYNASHGSISFNEITSQ